jgi:hypothetical protein
MDKVRENRIRRVAQRRGLKLLKSRRRDTHALDYGLYMLIQPDKNASVTGDFASLDAVEEWLNR